jgi:hypothetical protein
MRRLQQKGMAMICSICAPLWLDIQWKDLAIPVGKENLTSTPIRKPKKALPTAD